MKDHRKLEDIFKERLFNEEVATPEHLFERISAARHQRKRRAIWLRFAGLFSILAFLGGSIYYFSDPKPTNVQLNNGNPTEHAQPAPSLKHMNKGESEVKSSSDLSAMAEAGGTDPLNSRNINVLNKTGGRMVQNTSGDLEKNTWMHEANSNAENKEVAYEDRGQLFSENNAQPENNFPEVIENKLMPESEMPQISDQAEFAESEVSPEHSSPELPDLQPGKWSVLFSGGGGSMVPYYGRKQSNEQSLENSGFAPSIQVLTQYRFQNNWHLETGLSFSKGILIQEMNVNKEIWNMEVNEQRVKVYDPILPPYEIIVRDTAFSLKQESKTETARYQRTLVSIPVGISHTWWSRNWDVSTALGVQFHISQNHVGTRLDPGSGSLSVSELLLKQSNASAYTTLRVSRRINDRWNVLLAPSLAADIRSSEWKNNIRRRDLWWQLHTGLRYQF